MVAKSTKFVLKTAFGPKCKSPKEKEKTGPERKNGASMCHFGPEVSPKAGVVGTGSDIAAEHEIYA
ncbi:MAG: hypothetical protein ACPL7K_02070, partial [Armatimonadota bacterium]